MVAGLIEVTHKLSRWFSLHHTTKSKTTSLYSWLSPSDIVVEELLQSCSCGSPCRQRNWVMVMFPLVMEITILLRTWRPVKSHKASNCRCSPGSLLAAAATVTLFFLLPPAAPLFSISPITNVSLVFVYFFTFLPKLINPSIVSGILRQTWHVEQWLQSMAKCEENWRKSNFTTK